VTILRDIACVLEFDLRLTGQKLDQPIVGVDMAVFAPLASAKTGQQSLD